MCATTEERKRKSFSWHHKRTHTIRVCHVDIFYLRVRECNSETLCFLARGVHQKRLLGHSFVECLSNSETQFLLSSTPQAFRAARKRVGSKMKWLNRIHVTQGRILGKFYVKEIYGILGLWLNWVFWEFWEKKSEGSLGKAWW